MFRTFPKPAPALLALALAALGPVGCGSHTDNLCENISDCSLGGDTNWIHRCEAEATRLDPQASASGCRSQYDAYYRCADAHFECDGATANLPGCDLQKNALERCLNDASAQTACGAYAAALAGCPGPRGATPPGSPIVPPCTLSRQCEAQCYLDNVSNVCAPGLSELDAFTQCAGSCLP